MALGKMCACVLVAVCLLATADAFNHNRVHTMIINDSSEDDLEAAQLDNALDVLEQLQQLLNQAWNGNSGCQCSGLACQCCQDVNVPRIPFHKVCLGVGFLPKQEAVTLELKIDGKVIFHQELSVRKPITICVPIPTTPVKICISLHDIKFDTKSFSGCFRMSASILGFEVFHIELGCVHIKHSDSATTVLFSKTPIVEAAAILKTFSIEQLKKAVPNENVEDVFVDSEM